MSQTWVAGGSSALCLTLGEVHGSLPVDALSEVLVSEWGLAQGWTTVDRRLYQRSLAHGVTLKVQIDDLGRVVATQSLPGERISEGQSEQAIRQRHEEALAATGEEARLALGQLTAHAMIRLVERAAEELHMTKTSESVDSWEGTVVCHEMHLQVELR
jgi:hypothetical protein